MASPLPAIEIVKFVARDGYKQDPSVMYPAFEMLKNKAGALAYAFLLGLFLYLTFSSESGMV